MASPYSFSLHIFFHIFVVVAVLQLLFYSFIFLISVFNWQFLFALYAFPKRMVKFYAVVVLRCHINA